MKAVKSAVPIICIVLFFSGYDLTISTYPVSWLHVSGNLILDSNNTPVYLKGIGRTGDIQSASGMWSGSGDPVAEWTQKWLPINETVPLMDETFRCYQQYWHVNMIRLQILPSWYWLDNITPAEVDAANYEDFTISISYRTYIATVVEKAAKYGIYVDICPYELISNYQDSAYGVAQGLPLSGWDNYCAEFLKSTNLTEQVFWNQYWTLMANELKRYPNVIFEAWNEPDDDSGSGIVPSAYMSYLKITYNAIRSTGAQNLIFMQWGMGFVPTCNDLSWTAQINNALSNPANVVYTFHAYRHAPSFNTPWGTSYSTVKSQLTDAVASMGLNAPLVINEAGCCMSAVSSKDATNELNWWAGIVRSAQELNIGLTAYFWISDSDLAPVFYGESLVKGKWADGAPSPAPNIVGEIFIKNGSGQI